MATRSHPQDTLSPAPRQMLIWEIAESVEEPVVVVSDHLPSPTEEIDLFRYDFYLVYFSGGKDSMACLLYLLEMGIDKSKIEIWHNLIDGSETTPHFMDWRCTSSYCRRVAEALDIPIYFSYKVGGFEREMLRENALTAPIQFETPDGLRQVGGEHGTPNTRRKFPQVSADLRVRWCSAYLKTDCAATALRNQDRFLGKRVLAISGERAEESAARAHYKEFEPDRADNRNGINRPRLVDRYRPVHKWTEEMVWDIIKRFKIRPHPAYYLGWSRCSCAFCIFGGPHQWASAQKIDPNGVEKVANYETEFGITIHRTKTVMEQVALGTPYPNMPEEELRLALSHDYDAPIIIEEWVLPSGAFGDGQSCGPV